MSTRKKIGWMGFGLLSPQMIRKMAAAKIYTPNTYDEDGYPIEGGVMDPRLGVIDPGMICRTCGGRLGECQGHFGYIELTRPVVHVGYVKHIYTILRATCRNCGRFLVKQDVLDRFKDKELSPAEQEELLAKAESVTDSEGACPHCGEKQVKIKFVRPYSYYEEERHLLPTEIRSRFEKIPDEDLKFFGIKVRPEWTILTVLPVLPIVARPSITLESSERSEDDLTHKLVDILRINQRLEENINSGAPQLIIEDLWELLQYHVATYIDNSITGIPPARHRSGRPLKTLAQRLKGKEGRFRKNLSGKRVNFSARTVISPDPNISINEVVVPQAIAMELTIPERVREWNLEELRKLVRNGPDVYPGARSVITAKGRRRILKSNKEELAEALQVGDLVERHLIDGDLVLFNRQPSLHRISMMCHVARVLPHNTFRINTAVCAPYNADFDGDEMNLHVPQSEEAMAEADILLKVQECIISPRYGKPIIGGRHDHVTGVYLLTRKDVKLKRAEALELLRDLAKLPPGKRKFTGKEIFSLLLPKDLSLEYRTKFCVGCEECKKEGCPYDAWVKIENGQLVCGVMDSEGMAGELISEIFVRYGSDVCREFIDKSTKLALRVVMKFGFTIGIDEEDLPEDTKAKIEEIVEKHKARVKELIEMYQRGEIATVPGKSAEEVLEDCIMEELGKARDEAGAIASERLGNTSSAVLMAKIGARGSLLNVTQVAAIVGQQAVRGQRISRGYYGRALPHFKRGDLSPEAKGFVRSSFKDGLSPTEFFFHAMGGRESLVDTAIRTSQSGYMQRRLINALQDLIVAEDGSVRNSEGVIVQFVYGEDEVDPMKKCYFKL